METQETRERANTRTSEPTMELTPIDSEVLHRIVNRQEIKHLALSEITLISMVAIEEYRSKLSEERTGDVVASGFRKDM